MLDPFDFKEPSCALCGGKEFYNPDKNAPSGRIPIKRIIDKLDGFFNKNDMENAGKLLEYWQGEAISLNDAEGELEIDSELIGYYRKTAQKEKGLAVSERALELIDRLGLGEKVSAATIILNAATTFKSFGRARDALPLYDKVFSVYTRNLGQSDPLFGGFYNNKALALVDIKNYNEAEKCYRNALEITKKISPANPDIAVTFVNMAHMYDQMGEKNKITDCLFEAFAVLNREDAEKNGYYAYVCSKCAPSFAFYGYNVIEKQLLGRAKEIYERN